MEWIPIKEKKKCKNKLKRLGFYSKEFTWSLYASPLFSVAEKVKLREQLIEIGDCQHIKLSNQQCTLTIYNATVKDNGAYKAQVTYTKGGHDVSVVVGTKKLYVNGKGLIFLSLRFGKISEIL